MIKRFEYGEPSGINKGPMAGQERFYKDALFSSLIHLRPKFILELGSYFGGTTKVFEKYFSEYMPDGLLVTCDIFKYCDLESNRVRQVIVGPHIKNSNEWHQTGKILDYSPFSIQNNIDIIKMAYDGKFDYALIDGDHTKGSVERDLCICNRLLNDPKYILLDDTEEFEHDVASIYHNELKQQYSTYEFENWDCCTGVSLMWNKI